MNRYWQIKNSEERIELGKKGENIAASFLKKNGYKIIKRNYRIGHSDIDILAMDKKILVFIEVRTKSETARGMPEETLTVKKLNRMKKTAELYIAFNRYRGCARIDAVCIILDNSNTVKHLKHYKGVT